MKKRAVIITAPGFQDEEFIYPYYRLLEEGFQVDVATKDKIVVLGKYGIPAKPTRDAKELKEEDYDLVILPGGWEAPERVRLIKEVLTFVREMYEAGKVVGAICHGPCILVSAGILRGKRATCFEGIADDLINAGALYEDSPVVVDGNIVTSPHYRNNGDFLKAVLREFNKRSISRPSVVDYRKFVVNKPWGFEYLMYENDKVAIWYLFIKHGEETSLHCHPNKKTGLILLSGEARISFLNDAQTVKSLSKLMIRQGLFHSTAAVSPDGIHVIEIETPTDKSDLVRLTDKYGREGRPYGAEGATRPIDESCLRLSDDGGKHLLHGCSLSIETFMDSAGFRNRPRGEAIVVLRGGMVSRKGIPVLAAGDVIWSQNLDHLHDICAAPHGATILTIRKEP